MEARIYAEDPANDFLPAIGRLKYLSFPAASAFQTGEVRVDSGVRQGDDIPPWYDPMIAKLIVHGASRRNALQRLSQALANCRIAGTATNLSFLEALAQNADFINGAPDTGLIARDIASLIGDIPPTDEIIALASLADAGFLEPADKYDIWQNLRGWRHWSEAEIFSTLQFGDEEIERRIKCLAPDTYRIERGATPCQIEIIEGDGTSVSYISDGVRKRANVVSDDTEITVFQNSLPYSFERDDPLEGHHETASAGDVIAAPMPGLVKLISTAAGQEVRKGTALIVLEAMKMEHTLKATRDGRIAELHVAEGDQIAGGALLVTLESEDADG
jgi:3-methylcrotonyl-CoA carboxylase alpha subunit